MTGKDYADAIMKLSAHGESDASVVQGVTRALRARGETRLLPSIVRDLNVRMARAAALAPHVEVAQAKHAAHALKAAKALGIAADDAIVNPSLISGWRARGAGRLIDRSGKRALIDLYRAATR